jgi:UDP-N-acetylmuramoyl-tripeptide--D-alanyl-D-alanine ligase
MISTQELYTFFLKCSGVTTDSRKIEKNCLFIALKGEFFNGNSFAEEALTKGAAYAIVDEPKYQTSNRILLVENGLVALQQLALHHRNKLNTPLIALTGSNGKTTTKELIYAVLSTKYKTVATKGNLNNHIGVPLTLLRLKKTTEIGIIEMGANHQKEIAFLCSITHPDYGFITNYGKAHLEGFGGVDGVIKGKSEMYDYLIKNDKFVFYNEDDPIQTEKLQQYKNKTGFGSDDGSALKIQLAEEDDQEFLGIKLDDKLIRTQLTGTYNITNAAYAILLGRYFKVPEAAMITAIESYVPENNRSQLLQLGSNRIILDAYNANPSSMKAALQNLKMQKANHKIAILGDMFELGEEAKREHQVIADLAASLANTTTYLVGNNFFKAATHLPKFNDFEAFKNFLSKNCPRESTVLIKGSRGMALERILEIF